MGVHMYVSEEGRALAHLQAGYVGAIAHPGVKIGYGKDIQKSSQIWEKFYGALLRKLSIGGFWKWASAPRPSIPSRASVEGNFATLPPNARKNSKAVEMMDPFRKNFKFRRSPSRAGYSSAVEIRHVFRKGIRTKPSVRR